jgi:hypothetical protein
MHLFFLNKEQPRRAWKHYIKDNTVEVQVITKDPIEYRNNTWVPGKSRKDLAERYCKQSDPPFSPPSSHRQKPELPPSRTKAGTKPLAFKPTKTAAADL